MAELKPGGQQVYTRRMSKHKIDFQVLQAEEQSPGLISMDSLLLEAAHKTAVKVTIPEVLIQTSPTSHYLITSENGTVSVSHGSHTFNKFFELVDLATIKRGTRDSVSHIPLYVLKTSNSFKLCNTLEECINILRGTVGKCVVMRLVQSRSAKPLVYRVSFRQEKGITVYEVKNGRRDDTMRRFTEMRNPEYQTKQMSIYQHKAKDYVYAGKLYKASFSPYLPYQSRLKPPPAQISVQNSGSLSPPEISPLNSPRKSVFTIPWTSYTETAPRDLDYVVDTRNMHHCKVSVLEERVPELEQLIMELIQSLERGYRHKTVQSMSVDVVNGVDGGWYMVECSELQWQDSLQRQVRDIRAKMDSLDRVKVAKPMLQLDPPPSLFSSHSDRIIRRNPPLSPTSSSSLPHDHTAQHQLVQIQAKYDGILTQARKSKILSKDLIAEIATAQSNTKLLETVLEHAWIAVVKEMQTEKTSFEAGKETLMEVLTGSFKNTLKATKVSMHRKLGFTASQYSMFVQKVIQEAARRDLPADTIQQVQERLSFFELSA